MISRKSGVLGTVVLVVMILELFASGGVLNSIGSQSSLAAGVQPASSAALNTAITLSGGGATFPQPLIANWTVEYHNSHPNTTITFQSVGSGRGQSFLLNKTVDFAASDAPLSTRQLNLYPNVLHIPETIGSVTASYNLPGIAKGVLNLNGTVLANIYLNNITMWNDPQIQVLNPGLTLPAHAIQTVHRKDSSGTTFVFTSFLSLDNSVFRTTVGALTLPTWPPGGIAGQGNLGVAQTVNVTQYSIGYVELQYALTGNLTYAKIENADKTAFILPTLQSTQFAVRNASQTLPVSSGDWSGVSLLNAHGLATYPIASFTYLLVYREMNVVPTMDINDKAQFKALINFLNWAITTGQNFAPGNNYVALPPQVVAIDQAGINSMTYTEVSSPAIRNLSLHIGASGWNDSATGPAITLVSGDHVTINFASTDLAPHRWYIEFNNDNIQDANETNISFLFGTAGPNPYPFTPVILNATSIPKAGTFTYRDNNTGATGPITILPQQIAASFMGVGLNVDLKAGYPTIDTSRVATAGSLIIDMRTLRATGNVTVVAANIASFAVTFSKTYMFISPGLQLGTIGGQPGVQFRFVLNVQVPAPNLPLSSNVQVVLTGTTATVVRTLTRELDPLGRGTVDAVDVSAVASAYGTSTGQPGFDPTVDFFAHGVIDARDLGPFFTNLNQQVFR